MIVCGEDAIRMPAHRSVVAALPSAITATGSNSSLNANKGVTIDFQKAEKIDERGVEDFRSSRSDPEQVHNPKLIQGIRIFRYMRLFQPIWSYGLTGMQEWIPASCRLTRLVSRDTRPVQISCDVASDRKCPGWRSGHDRGWYLRKEGHPERFRHRLYGPGGPADR